MVVVDRNVVFVVGDFVVDGFVFLCCSLLWASVLVICGSRFVQVHQYGGQFWKLLLESCVGVGGVCVCGGWFGMFGMEFCSVGG